MPRRTPAAAAPPAAVEAALRRLGANIRTARLRRRMTQTALAERVGVSRFVVADVERGKPGTQIAAYLGALWVLGLLDQVRDVADPTHDEEGQILERQRGAERARSEASLSDDF